MSRKRNPVPSYRQSGQAVITIRTLGGGRRDLLLGPYGSEESKTEYARIVGELRAAVATDAVGRTAGLTVAEVLLAFRKYAEGYYVAPDGQPSGEFREFGLVIRVVRKAYAHTPAKDFGPLALKAVRKTLEESGLARGVINQRIGRVKRIFKWATSEELVPPHDFHGLMAVSGLRRGKTTARETAPICPVASSHVEATLPHLTPTVRAMVLVQRLTGMRPGELCSMRPQNVDRTGANWIYSPPQHKTAHHGRTQAILIGPRAQAILAPFLDAAGSDGYVFDPAKSRAEWYDRLRSRRKSRVQPSQVCRKKSKKELKRPAPRRFDPGTYAASIAAAIRRQNRDAVRHDVSAGHHGPNYVRVSHWHPHRLRHSAATEVRSRFGLEAAQVLLGHARADVTQVYAERNLDLAAQVANELG